MKRTRTTARKSSTTRKTRKAGPKVWRTRVTKERTGPDTVRVTTDDGLFQTTSTHTEGDAAVRQLASAPAVPWPPIRETLVRLRAYFGEILDGARHHPENRFPGTQADRALWRRRAEDCLADVEDLETTLATGDPELAAAAAFALGAATARWSVRTRWLEPARKRRHSRDALGPRQPGPVWRAVRLAVLRNPRLDTGKLQELWEKASAAADPEGWARRVKETDPLTLQAHFRSQLSRRRKAWLAGKN